jgi:hypothetical protein
MTTLECRDATISLGDDLIELSTECKFLSEQAPDVQPISNKLYYAMDAINRLDKTAEGYPGVNMDGSANTSHQKIK